LTVRPAIAQYPPGATYGPRTLVDFELVWMLSGVARWRHLQAERELALHAGDVLLIHPGTRDEFQWDEQVPTRHGYLHFKASGADVTGWPSRRSAQIPGPLGGLLDYLLWLGEEPTPGWQGRADDILAATVRAFVDGPLPEPDHWPETPALTAALAYVRQAWADGGMRPISLADLAAAASVSKGYLARQFHERYGLGAVTALDLIRLDHARTLLTRTNLTVTEVARTCGFVDPLHFSRRFRSVGGLAPRDYRKMPMHTELIPASVRVLAHRLTPSTSWLPAR